MVLRHVDTLSGMEAVADRWRALETRAGTPLGYFQTYDWCRAWAQTFAGPDSGRDIFIQTAWRGKDMVAVWPLMRFTRTGLRRVATLGDPYSQYSNVVFDPTQLTESELEGFITKALQAADVDVAAFDAVPARSALARHLGVYPGSVTGQNNESLILDLTRWPSSEAYAAAQSRDQKRGRERKRRQLARHGELSFEIVWPDNPEFGPLVHRAIDMKREWLKKTGRLSVGMMANSENFFSQLSGSEQRLCGAVMSVLRVGGQVVAIEIGFLQNKHYYGHIGSFDWDFAAFSPGKVQIEMTIRWLIDQGVARYDFLANATDYKRSWSNLSEPLKSFAVPFGFKGRIYAEAWLPSLKPALKRAYYAMPAALRRLTSGVQGLAAALIVF
jgi:CelD/BcsL family acetyltransferase involved in cellulose biosynthesis